MPNRSSLEKVLRTRIVVAVTMLLRAGFVVFVLFNVCEGVSSSPESVIHVSALPKCRVNNEMCSETFNAIKSNTYRGVRYPCICSDGQCGCCTGNFLQNFNVNMKQRFCLNMTYDSDDAAIGMKFSFNELVFYKSSVSGKNPPPMCVPIPRFTSIRFCVRLTNVYFIDRNFHACVNVESQWNRATTFTYNFDCIRIGLNGVAVVSPEDGGGLPEPVSPDVDVIEEYDELLENQSTTTRRPGGNKKKNRTRPATTKKPVVTVLPAPQTTVKTKEDIQCL